MTITTTKEQNTVTIMLEGRLDTNTSPDLEEELEKSVTPEIVKLVIDMEKLDYISSAGLRVMVVAQDKMDDQDGEFIVANVNSVVMEVFELTGFSNMLTFE